MDAERLGGPSALAGERQRVRATETTDAEWVERQRALARERQRRRRVNPSVRAKETAAKRQWRLANPHRAREAQRERRAANPELRKKEAEAKRQRRAANPAVRKKETEMKRRWRQGNPDLRKREAQMKKRQRRGILETEGAADARDCSFGHICDVCDRLWFDNNLVRINNIQSAELRAKAVDVLENEFPATSSTSFGEFQVCATCKDPLVSGKLPRMSITNGCRRNWQHASCTTLTAETDFGVVPMDGIDKNAVSSSQGTQATIPKATIATQCALEFLTSSGCQTHETFPAFKVKGPLACGFVKEFRGVRDSADNTDGDPADRLGNHIGLYCPHSSNTGTVANNVERTQLPGTLDRCGSCKLCKAEDSAPSTQNEVGAKKVSYMCRLCKKVLYCKTNLKAHIRMHTGERPFVCTVCQRSFIRKWDLVSHLNVHAQKRPHVCRICRRAFTTRRALIKHEKKHASRRC